MNGQEVLRSAVTHAEVTRRGNEGGRRRAWTSLWVAALLAILGFLVIYPVLTLLLGALTDTNPVVDGFSLTHLSIANFLAVLVNPNVAEALFNTLAGLRRRHLDRGRDRAGVFLDRGSHQHAVQGFYRRRQRAAAVRAAAGRGRGLDHSGFAEDRA